MTPSFKRGATARILLDQFTDEEWSAIHPWGAIKADAQQGSIIHPMTITADPDARTILLSADTATWSLRLARVDVRIERGGVTVYLPGASTLQVEIVAPITMENT
ncbi:hypothetical protein [Paracoccus marcusii]|uniref:hypothetical protein n=1 Tax=Paracoccus marcusii TaxID=59779 RepID=UPI0035A5EC0C